MAKINRQRYKLYGIEIPDLYQIHKEEAVTPLLTSKAMPSISIDTKKPDFFSMIYGQKTPTDVHPLIMNLVAKNWYDKKTTN